MIGSRALCCSVFLSVGVLLLATLWTMPCSAQGSAELDKVDDLKMNQIQVIGSHNSFKAAVDPQLLELMKEVDPKAVEFDYAHPPLRDQLNLGLRNLELDVFHDPEGGRYAKPLGLKLSAATARPYDPQGKMLKPGFKVLHVQDIDFRSNCLTLSDAMMEIRQWSNRHPRHLPVLITFNVTDREIPLPGAVKPLPFDRAALDELDAALREGFGEEKIILPAEVQGEHETLESAVLAGAWPTLRQARGRFVLVLDDFGRKRDAYLEDHAGLKGRAMFVNTVPGKPEAAIMIRNGPVPEQEHIKDLVGKGYIVRTRADANTQEPKNGDDSRFQAAKSSGAQVISTDYYLSDWRLNPSYRVRFDRDRCCRLNPVTAADLLEKSPQADLE